MRSSIRSIVAGKDVADAADRFFVAIVLCG